MNFQSVPLGQVSSIDPSPPAGIRGEVAFVPMACVSEDGTMRVGEIRPASSVSSGYSYFQNGDLLVAKITPCFENNKIALADIQFEHGFGSTEFHVMRANPAVLECRYLFHYLRQERIRRLGEQRMTGSAGQRRVPRQFLSNLNIPLPSLPDQRRIAAILDQADSLRRMRAIAQTKLDDLRSAIFQAEFGDPVRNEKKWRRVRLRELLNAIESGTSPICLDRPAESHEWGVLRLSAVTSCKFDGNAQKALPPNIAPLRKLELKAGDVLFSRKNTYSLVGACALVREVRRQLLLPDLIFRLALRNDALIVREYLYQLLITPSKRAQIQSLAGGSAGSMPNISKAKLQDVEIELPPMEMQLNFEQRANLIERMRQKVSLSATRLEELERSLEQTIFRNGSPESQGAHPQAAE